MKRLGLRPGSERHLGFSDTKKNPNPGYAAACQDLCLCYSAVKLSLFTVFWKNKISTDIMFSLPYH